ncbi:MAG: hypothetical protein NVS1B2_16760 [Vulcanimicrobiaceae bacterium]
MYDQTDERNIPVSAGIPRVIYVSAVIGIILIFTMLFMVFYNSGANHGWPASSTLTVPLKK